MEVGEGGAERSGLVGGAGCLSVVSLTAHFVLYIIHFTLPICTLYVCAPCNVKTVYVDIFAWTKTLTFHGRFILCVVHETTLVALLRGSWQ